ncbi:MAG: LysR family transcriptional regulator [Xanthomonadaceae bacterium]|nr:LysR family transcriptional regulator [Xanthomonadaceae bacterium]
MDLLHAMDVFVAIVEKGSLTAAADALDTSLPTVVRTLAALEREVGVRLFHRTTRRLSITEDGRVYLAHVKQVRDAVEASRLALARTRSQPEGVICCTAPVTFGELHVAPSVARYMQAHPRVQVRLLLLDRLVDLVQEGVDVAIRIAPLADSSLIARSVAEVHQLIVASPKFLRRVGTPRLPQDLQDQPCVLHGGLGELGSWQFQVDGRPQRVRVHGRLTCNTIGATVAACREGAGFARLLDYQVAPFIKRDELKRVLQAFEPPPRPVSLVYSRFTPGSVRMTSFLDWMQRDLGAGRAMVLAPSVAQKGRRQ